MKRPAVAEVQTVLMDRYEAEQKTGRIRANIEENRRLVKEIYDRGGWKALGYGSFDEWGSCELGLSRPHLYHLIGAGRIEEHINENLSSVEDKRSLMGTPEYTLRPLSKLLEPKNATDAERAEARARINEAWDIANERSNGEPTGAIVAEAVDAVLGNNRPLPGQTSFLDEEDEEPHVRSEPRRNEAGEAWAKMLGDFSTYYTSIQNGGGIARVSRHWTPERRQGYLERCREIGDLFYRMADELEQEE